MSTLPPYSEYAPAGGSVLSPQVVANTMASNTQTCSINDRQHDYYKIVSESTARYYVCLTVDPTPIYRVEFSKDPSAVGDVMIFPVTNGTSVPIAAARLVKSLQRGEPVAMICTELPHFKDSKWQPVTKDNAGSSYECYKSSIPIVKVPGMEPKLQAFGWQTLIARPNFELWWDGHLSLQSPRLVPRSTERDRSFVFATCSIKRDRNDLILEMRRGGGLQFELAALIQLFVILRVTWLS